VLDSAGRGQATFITRGIDEAMIAGSHLVPGVIQSSPDVVGWRAWLALPDGRCQLCMAIDNVLRLENVTAVVAAGNDHNRCEFRAKMDRRYFRPELNCPATPGGHHRGGDLKQAFVTAPFSSHGQQPSDCPNQKLLE
jgi:hypothetical protein